jgi:hypothetical protein
LDLTIFEAIKQGKNPAKVSQELGVSRQKLYWYTNTLRRLGFIRNIGYGTWEILKPFEEVQQVQVGTSRRSDSVRAHGFIFTLELPANLRNWDSRQTILTQQGIAYKPCNNILGGAQLVTIDGKKVYLTNKSIVIYETASFFANTSQQAMELAWSSLRETVRKVQTKLGINLPRYKIRISRQHYALIQNAFAKQCDKNKFLVQDKNGEYWLIVDNSFNLHELETVHTKTAKDDNRKIQDFFNGVKEYNDFTPQVLLEIIGKAVEVTTRNSELLAGYGKEISSHVKAIRRMGDVTEKLGDTVEYLTREVKRRGMGRESQQSRLDGY